MNRLKYVDNVIYDANIIIYQCFPEERYRIIGLTKLSRNLTRFLFNQNSSIIVPGFIVTEIERKGFLRIIDEYLSSNNINNIFNPPKYVDEAFKFKLYKKIRINYNKLKQHDNFLVEEYYPSKNLMDDINAAFDDFNKLDNIENYFTKKQVNQVNISNEDKMLILFSKEKGYPIISNDLDLTFFADELIKRDLVTEIIEFKSISINN